MSLGDATVLRQTWIFAERVDEFDRTMSDPDRPPKGRLDSELEGRG